MSYFQPFSLPPFIITYLIQNPTTPSIYRKLIRTCKHFFFKHRIFPVEYLTFSNTDEEVWLFGGPELKSYPVSKFSQSRVKFWINHYTIIRGINASNWEVLLQKYFGIHYFEFPISADYKIKVKHCVEDMIESKTGNWSLQLRRDSQNKQIIPGLIRA